jgi:hypothetical protein
MYATYEPDVSNYQFIQYPTSPQYSGGFTFGLNGFPNGQTYYVRAYVTNSLGSSYSNTEVVYMPFANPLIDINSITRNSQTSATITYSITTQGNNVGLQGSGVVIGVTQSNDLRCEVFGTQCFAQSGPIIGQQTITITLPSNFGYPSRIYAINGDGISFYSSQYYIPPF